MSTQVISQISQNKWEYVTPEIKEINGKKTRQAVGWMNGPLFKLPTKKQMYNGVNLPREDDYHDSPAACTYIKFMNDEVANSNPEVSKFFDYLSKLDDNHDSDEFKKKHLGKEYKKFEYSRIVKENSKGIQNVKAKYITDRDSGNIQTKFGLVTGVDSDGTRTIEKLNITDYNDVIKELGDNSTLEFFLKFKKFWAQKPNMKDPTYGITLEVVQVLIVDRTMKSAGMSDFLKNDEFIDGSQVTSASTSNSSPVENVFQKPTEDVTNSDKEQDSDNSESSDSDSESDDEESPPPPKKTAGRKKKN